MKQLNWKIADYWEIVGQDNYRRRGFTIETFTSHAALPLSANQSPVSGLPTNQRQGVCLHRSNICVKERVTTSLPMRCQYPGHVITLDETVIEYLKQDFSTSAILSSPYNENRAEGHNSNLWRQNEIHPRPIKPKNANLLKTSSLDEYLNFILC